MVSYVSFFPYIFMKLIIYVQEIGQVLLWQTRPGKNVILEINFN